MKPVRLRYPKGPRAPNMNGRPRLVVIFKAVDNDDPELQYYWRGDRTMKSDTRLLMQFFEDIPSKYGGKTLKEELIERGYDISTFRFSVERLPDEEV